MARRDEGRARRLSPAQERMLRNVAEGREPFHGVSGRSAHGGGQATRSSLERDGFMMWNVEAGAYEVTAAGRTRLLEAQNRRAEQALKVEAPRMSESAADTKARELVRAYLVHAFPDYPHLHAIRGRAERKLVTAIKRELLEASRP